MRRQTGSTRSSGLPGMTRSPCSSTHSPTLRRQRNQSHPARSSQRNATTAEWVARRLGPSREYRHSSGIPLWTRLESNDSAASTAACDLGGGPTAPPIRMPRARFRVRRGSRAAASVAECRLLHRESPGRRRQWAQTAILGGLQVWLTGVGYGSMPAAGARRCRCSMDRPQAVPARMRAMPTYPASATAS